MDSCENFEIESHSFSACNNVVPKRYFSLYQQATGCTKPKKKRYHIDAKRSGQHGMKINKHEILISPAMAYLAFYILFWEN